MKMLKVSLSIHSSPDHVVLSPSRWVLPEEVFWEWWCTGQCADAEGFWPHGGHHRAGCHHSGQGSSLLDDITCTKHLLTYWGLILYIPWSYGGCGNPWRRIWWTLWRPWASVMWRLLCTVWGWQEGSCQNFFFVLRFYWGCTSDKHNWIVKDYWKRQDRDLFLLVNTPDLLHKLWASKLTIKKRGSLAVLWRYWCNENAHWWNYIVKEVKCT